MVRLTEMSTDCNSYDAEPTSRLVFDGYLNPLERNKLVKAFQAGPIYLDLASEPCGGTTLFQILTKNFNAKKETVKEMLFGGAWYENGKPVYITRVLYNDPATVVFWNDGSKTVAKCAKEDKYNKETGLAIAVLKKAIGNTTVTKTLADWLPTDDKTKIVDLKDLRAKKRATAKATKTSSKETTNKE